MIIRSGQWPFSPEESANPAFNTAWQQSCGKVMFSVVSVYDHYPWYIRHHCTGPHPIPIPGYETSLCWDPSPQWYLVAITWDLFKLVTSGMPRLGYCLGSPLSCPRIRRVDWQNVSQRIYNRSIGFGKNSLWYILFRRYILNNCYICDLFIITSMNYSNNMR